MIEITDIAFVFHPVTDVVRSRKFYEGILGLKTLNVTDTEGGPLVEYAVGPARLAIGEMDIVMPSGDGVIAALEVKDFESAVAALRKANVEFYMEPFVMSLGEMAMILDPDGSKICILERGSETAS